MLWFCFAVKGFIWLIESEESIFPASCSIIFPEFYSALCLLFLNIGLTVRISNINSRIWVHTAAASVPLSLSSPLDVLGNIYMNKLYCFSFKKVSERQSKFFLSDVLRMSTYAPLHYYVTPTKSQFCSVLHTITFRTAFLQCFVNVYMHIKSVI